MLGVRWQLACAWDLAKWACRNRVTSRLWRICTWLLTNEIAQSLFCDGNSTHASSVLHKFRWCRAEKGFRLVVLRSGLTRERIRYNTLIHIYILLLFQFPIRDLAHTLRVWSTDVWPTRFTPPSNDWFKIWMGVPLPATGVTIPPKPISLPQLPWPYDCTLARLVKVCVRIRLLPFFPKHQDSTMQHIQSIHVDN